MATQYLFDMHVIKSCRTLVSILDLGAVRFHLTAIAWRTTCYCYYNWRCRCTVNETIPCIQLMIFDTHYVMRELAPHDKTIAKTMSLWSRRHTHTPATHPYTSNAIRNVRSKTLFEMMTYQLAFAYKICINTIFYVSHLTHTRIWQGNLFKSCFD